MPFLADGFSRRPEEEGDSRKWASFSRRTAEEDGCQDAGFSGRTGASQAGQLPPSPGAKGLNILSSHLAEPFQFLFASNEKDFQQVKTVDLKRRRGGVSCQSRLTEPITDWNNEGESFSVALVLLLSPSQIKTTNLSLRKEGSWSLSTRAKRIMQRGGGG